MSGIKRYDCEIPVIAVGHGETSETTSMIKAEDYDAAVCERKFFSEALSKKRSEVERLRADLENAATLMKRVTEEKAAMRAKLAERNALLKNAEKVIEQFMPNVGKCFGIDFALLNETLVELRATLSVSAEQSEPVERKPA